MKAISYLCLFLIVIVVISLVCVRCKKSIHLYFENKENILRQTLTDINAEFLNNKGTIKKELSFKIEKNRINDDRYIYMLMFPPNTIRSTKIFNNILERTGLSDSFLSHFPHVDPANVVEIILGVNGKTNKLYVTSAAPTGHARRHGEIMAVECLEGECQRKFYELIYTPTKNMFKSLHPHGTEIYNTFSESPVWKIKKNGEVSLHIMTDRYMRNLHRIEDVQENIYKWVQHLLPKKQWDEWATTHKNMYLYILAISATSVTLYIRKKT